MPMPIQVIFNTYLGCEFISYEEAVLNLDRTNHIIVQHLLLLLLLQLLLLLLLLGVMAATICV